MNGCRLGLHFLNFTVITFYPLKRLLKTMGAKRSSVPTIYALASGHGKCGVAVLRVSGPSASTALLNMACLKQLPEPRRITLRRVVDSTTRELLDKGLVVWFPGPASFTGEDCCEFHVHGGPAVVAAALTSFSKLPGFRMAEPGEFSKRAFINGKLDLTEVEGLVDVIHAETEAQRKQALRQMDGELGKLYNNWSQQLLRCLAHVEAFIDFSEDDNIEDGVLEEVISSIQNLQANIQKHLHDSRKGERLRSGVHVSIIGKPNVGKSTLLNTICQKPTAIVSPIAGTTRDVLEAPVDIGGYPVLFSDTAGLRDSNDTIEKEGVRRAKAKAATADLILLIIDAKELECHFSKPGSEFKAFVANHVEQLELENRPDSDIQSPPCTWKSDGNILIIINKIDTVKTDSYQMRANSESYCLISCHTGENMEEFLTKLCSKVAELCVNTNAEGPTISRARHKTHLTKCLQNLQLFFEYLHDEDIVLSAETLRKALQEISKITGRVSTENILDVIFQDFCIGK